MIAREGASLKRSPLPRAPSLRDGGRGTLGGEAASLREAPLPPDPSLPKSGWRSAGLLLHGWFRLSVGASPVSLVVGTAADRAAATLRREGTEPLRPLRGHLPFQGRLWGWWLLPLKGSTRKAHPSPAATMQREGAEPLRPLRGHLPFQGRLWGWWLLPLKRFHAQSASFPRRDLTARGGGTPPPASRAPPLSGEAFGSTCSP